MKKYILTSDKSQLSPILDRYRDDLNTQQFEVVTSEGGPMLVIAGAGSGKTRVVTYRVAFLLESGIDPSRILLATFTNKASEEMLRRVEFLASPSAKKVWGGTFHHLGNLILRRHADLLGYERNYTILDEEDSKELIEVCISDLKINTKEVRFPKGDILQDIFSLSFNTKKKIEDITVDRYPFFYHLLDEIKQVKERYRNKKKEMNLMDYDDLLSNWEVLFLANEEIKENYAKRFLHVLVDEYQDTNKIQSDIVDLLASFHRNLMVVGDDAQSIYSFRGASFENIIDFQKRYPECKIYKLETNYRSTPHILNLANQSISNNIRQHKKVLHANKKGGFLPALVACRNVEEQANFVAQRILELRDEGYSLNEIAVLYRSHYHSLELQVELTRRGIPYYVRSGIRFFEQAHIKDVISYLRIVNNPKDEVGWRRALKLYPKIGNITAHKIFEIISKFSLALSDKSLNEVEVTLRGIPKESWKKFRQTISVLAEEPYKDNPAESISRVIEDAYKDYLQTKYPNFESRLEDLEQLMLFAMRYETTESFLSELSLISGPVGEDIIMREEEDEILVLSTIHQAKGLEWGVVFLIWLAEGRMPSSRSLDDIDGEEEERRLFYVAVTRAKDSLYLIYPLMTNSWHKGEIILRPSRFITELPKDVYEEWQVVS